MRFCNPNSTGEKLKIMDVLTFKTRELLSECITPLVAQVWSKEGLTSFSIYAPSADSIYIRVSKNEISNIYISKLGSVGWRCTVVRNGIQSSSEESFPTPTAALDFAINNREFKSCGPLCKKCHWDFWEHGINSNLLKASRWLIRNTGLGCLRCTFLSIKARFLVKFINKTNRRIK